MDSTGNSQEYPTKDENVNFFYFVLNSYFFIIQAKTKSTSILRMYSFCNHPPRMYTAKKKHKKYSTCM